MKYRCNVCGSTAETEDNFSTVSGNICRECVNSMCIYDLSELSDEEDMAQFINRLAEFIGAGGKNEEI